MPLPASGEGRVPDSEGITTHVTLTVLGDIRDTLKLGFSHEYEDLPVIAESRETAWNFGTIVPQKGALVASEFSDAVAKIEGRMGYELPSNDFIECWIGHGRVGDNDISLLKPFFWLRTWEDSDFTGTPTRTEHLVSEPIPPSYEDELTFPIGIKIDMLPQGEHAGPDLVGQSGSTKPEVISEWFLWQPGDGDMPKPVVTRTGHVPDCGERHWRGARYRDWDFPVMKPVGVLTQPLQSERIGPEQYIPGCLITGQTQTLIWKWRSQ